MATQCVRSKIETLSAHPTIVVLVPCKFQPFIYHTLVCALSTDNNIILGCEINTGALYYSILAKVKILESINQQIVQECDTDNLVLELGRVLSESATSGRITAQQLLLSSRTEMIHLSVCLTV